MKTLSLALAVLALAAPAASADSLLVDAPGARNVHQAGGHTAWVQPEGRLWRLVVRGPDGTVTRPDVAPFGSAPDPTVAAAREARSPALVPYVVYARCEGTSALLGCDVHRLDLRTGRETRVPGASSPRVSETAPGAAGNVITFVRRGPGVARRAKGVHYTRLGRGDVRRVSDTLARETATNGTRVAYNGRTTVVVRRLAEPREGAIVFRGEEDPGSLLLDRYRVAFLVRGAEVRESGRFGGSGDPTTTELNAGRRPLTETTNSIALLGGEIRLYADANGVKRVEPDLL
jgi:hypothetical protein